MNTPDQPLLTTGIRIRTSINEEGKPSVLLQVIDDEPASTLMMAAPLRLALTPDAAMDIGLHLIHAAASARAEEALYHIGNEKHLSVQDLIKWMRGPHA